MSYKVSEIHQNFLILEGGAEFSIGLLYLHNIYFDGEEMSLPFAKDIMKRLQKNTSLLKNIRILKRFGTNDEYALLSYDCKNLINAPSTTTKLSENTIYKGIVIAKTINSAIISVNGCFGYVDGPNAKNIEDTISVAIIKNCESQFGFYKFIEANEVENVDLENIEISEVVEEFLSQEELAVIENQNIENTEWKEKIEWVLNNIDGITRKNINVVRYELHLSFNPNIQSDLTRFLQDHPRYFSDNNFWIGGYKDKRTNDIKFIIYDSNDVVIETQVNERGIWVQEFSHNKNKSNAQFLLNSNVKALVISGSNIVFHEHNYLCQDYLHVGNKILHQLYVAKEILPQLKKTIKSLKERAGVEYLILKKYLTYQENKEREYNRENIVNIPSGNAKISTSANKCETALSLDLSTNISSLFVESDEDVCHVEIISNSTKINAELKMNENNDGYNIEFYNNHLDIEGIRKEGFEIRRRAGVKHLVVQKESIDNFVYGEGNIDIFDKLNRGELIPPIPEEDIVFFDSKFSNVEEGNNQPLAIKKAVNNNDIFLIQGPPGTGKTSVIVEIIKQLVINRGERVLVCSQAHSAVKNIFDRLNGVDDRIKIGNIDEESTMTPDDLYEHPEFLKNNELLLKKLENCTSIQALKDDIIHKYQYESSAKKIFNSSHEYICDYYNDNKPNSSIEWIEILSELHNGLIELGDDAKAFNNARHYQSLNVVMGTCIGIGMNTDLQRSGMVFDTVIIDEAGKANLSETTVPMKLGKKYILVGDNKQLPPFIDTEDIYEFIENSEGNLSRDEVEDAISSSLFEDFLEDVNFPKESSVLLNYQYRMNPEIGNYISELFYNEALLNGKGTEKQVCNLRSFPSAVTFIDTSSIHEKAYENGSSKEGLYNTKEISIFRERLLPKLLDLFAEDSNINVGIITPYRRQRALFLKEVEGTPLNNSVYTIDSIQGSEFDIVILSLVRAFNTKNRNKTVGFLDDMRRLNVALSRAKKKLIIIGNLDTLCDEKAHFKMQSNINVNPIEVFNKLRLIQDRTTQKTSLDSLMSEVKYDRIPKGSIIKNCTWKYDKHDRNKININLEINGDIHTFPMKADRLFSIYGTNNETINVEFLDFDKNGRALFKYVPDITISEMIDDGVLFNVKAKMIEWIDDDKMCKAIFEFEDGSDAILNISNDFNPKHIIWDLLESEYIDFIPVYVNNYMVSLDIKPYNEFREKYKEGDNLTVTIIDDTYQDYYIVKYGDVYGKLNKYNRSHLKRNQDVKVYIYRVYLIGVTFNLVM